MHIVIKSLFVLSLQFLSISFCFAEQSFTPAWWTAPLSNSSENRKIVAMQKVFAKGFDTIAKTSFKSIDIPSSLIQTFADLSRFDNKLKVTYEHTEKIAISYDNQEISSFRISVNDSLENWSRVTSLTSAEILKNSPTLNKLGINGFYEIIFTALLRNIDNNSHYLSPYYTEKQIQEHVGTGIIGIHTQPHKDGLKITDIDTDYACDLKIGNIITDIEGLPVNSIPKEDIAKIFQGEPETSLSVNIKYRAEPVILKRQFKSASTKDILKTENDLAIIRIENFNFGIANIIEKLIRALPLNIKAIVFDLTDSKGGLFTEAIKIADLFLSDELIISVKGRDSYSNKNYFATPKTLWRNKPIFILQDNQTKSSAEVLSSALKETNRAIVIGTPSFGKGSIQTATRLPNGGELLITSAEMFSHTSNQLDNIGVEPHICITDKTPCPKASIESADILLPLVSQSLNQ